jgi:Tfp pilus assembly protein PilE
MIVVVILGILAAIAIPLYMKFVQSAKAGEARLNLGKVASLLERYYDSRANQATSAVVTLGVSTTMIAQFPQNATNCATINGAVAVPRAIADVANKKYTPSEGDWFLNGGANTAWSEIPFAITQPIAYQYCYAGTGVSNASIFTTGAFGDVDGDGVYSTFIRNGAVLCGATGGCAPAVGAIVVTNETE